MIELERTFLLKFFPEEMKTASKKEIVDCYVPADAEHPTLRIRKNGDKFEITKKQPTEKDASEQTEETILLTEHEFKEISSCRSKDVSKIRYTFDYKERPCEIDVFTGPLKGLVLVDFEFSSKEEKDSFTMPDFCLAEVTQEGAIAGGLLAGKSFEDVEAALDKYS